MNGRIPGENIDTGSHLGEHPEYSGAWSDWVLRRLSHMRVMRHAGLDSRRGSKWENAVQHSLVVNATAVFIAGKMVEAGVRVDIDVVDQASLLHGIEEAAGKAKGASDGTERRTNRLRSTLEDAGYASQVIAAAECTGEEVIEMSIPDEGRQKAAIAKLSWEELVVGYADAIVRNTDIVSLETVPENTTAYDKWYPYYKNVETRIMEAIGDPGFTPQSIDDNSVRTMVAGAAVRS